MSTATYYDRHVERLFDVVERLGHDPPPFDVVGKAPKRVPRAGGDLVGLDKLRGGLGQGNRFLSGQQMDSLER